MVSPLNFFLREWKKIFVLVLAKFIQSNKWDVSGRHVPTKILRYKKNYNK